VRFLSGAVSIVGSANHTLLHVGIGTDMDGIGPSAIFTSYARWPSLAAALVDHGYRPEEAAKILGGNAQRVFRRVGAGAPPRGGV